MIGQTSTMYHLRTDSAAAAACPPCAGAALITAATGLPASLAISTLTPIERRSRIPGRDTIRQKSAARTAASAALSTAGALSMKAKRAPLFLAAHHGKSVESRTRFGGG